MHHPTEPTNLINEMADLLSADDDAQFASLFPLLKQQVKATSFSLIACIGRQSPVVVQCYAEDPLLQKRLTAYRSGYYRLDPFYHLFQRRHKEGVYALYSIAPESFEENEYFTSFMRTFRLGDEINVLTWLCDESALLISIGRPAGVHRFSESDVAFVRSFEPIFSAIAKRLWIRSSQVTSRVAPDSSSFHVQLQAALGSFGSSVLTPREKDVLDCFLQGHTVKLAARRLGVSPGTVRTHRHSIYGKLAVRTQSELFALLLESLKRLDSIGHGDPCCVRELT